MTGMMWLVLFGIMFNAIAGGWLIRTGDTELGVWLAGLAAMGIPLFIWTLMS